MQEIGDDTDGYRSAVMRCCDARTASSADERYGIFTLDGNHVGLSLIRVALVFFKCIQCNSDNVWVLGLGTTHQLHVEPKCHEHSVFHAQRHVCLVAPMACD